MRHQTKYGEIHTTIIRLRHLRLSPQTVALSHTFKSGGNNNSLVMYACKSDYHCREEVRFHTW
jgi:hypothetical protein